MKNELKRLVDTPHVGSVRQAGLMAGIELVKNKNRQTPYPAAMRMGARICRDVQSRGIWLRPLGDVVVLMPPPVISDSDLRFMIRSVGDIILHETKD